MSDPTEAIRKELVVQINAEPGSREALEAEHGEVWDTNQLREDFEVLGFGARAGGRAAEVRWQAGSLFFQHNPRFYFDFQAQVRRPGDTGAPAGNCGGPRPFFMTPTTGHSYHHQFGITSR